MADIKIISNAAGSGYVTIQDNGSDLPQETILNFVGANVSIVDNPGAGSTDVTITTSSSTTYTVETTNTSMVVNNGYIANSASNITFTLPASAGVGATFYIANKNTGNIIIAQNAGQSIIFGDLVTTAGTGGNLTGTSKGDGLTIVCCTTNTGFIVTSSIGQINVT